MTIGIGLIVVIKMWSISLYYILHKLHNYKKERKKERKKDTDDERKKDTDDERKKDN